MRIKRNFWGFFVSIGACLLIPVVVVTPIVGLMNPNVFAVIGLVQCVVMVCVIGLVYHRII